MRNQFFVQGMKLLASGLILLQAGGCMFDLQGITEVAQTVFLGITAAGSLAILRNI